MKKEKKAGKKGTSTKDKSKAKGAPETDAHDDPIARFRPAALKIKDDKVLSCRADVRIAYANIQQGIQSVFGAPEDPARKDNISFIKKALPELSTKKVLELPDLAQALMLAAGKVAPPVSTGEINEKLAVVRELREHLLTTAEVLAQKGLFDKAVVAKIRSGSGKYDTASDGAALYQLYKENADKLSGKPPFTDDELERLREASAWLLDHLTPGGARPKEPAKKSDAEDLRDRLFTLVVERHSDLRLMAYYRFREAFDQAAPRLQSRVVASARPSSTEGQGSEPAPAAAPGPGPGA